MRMPPPPPPLCANNLATDDPEVIGNGGAADIPNEKQRTVWAKDRARMLVDNGSFRTVADVLKHGQVRREWLFCLVNNGTIGRETAEMWMNDVLMVVASARKYLRERGK